MSASYFTFGLAVGMAIIGVGIAFYPEADPEPVVIEGPTVEMASLVGTQCMTEAAVRVAQTANDDRDWHKYTASEALGDCMKTCRSLSDWDDAIAGRERACALAAQTFYLEKGGL